MAVTNCSGERSFSTLERVKCHKSNSLGDEKTNDLSLLAIENDLLNQIPNEQIIESFAALKSCK